MVPGVSVESVLWNFGPSFLSSGTEIRKLLWAVDVTGKVAADAHDSNRLLATNRAVGMFQAFTIGALMVRLLHFRRLMSVISKRAPRMTSIMISLMDPCGLRSFKEGCVVNSFARMSWL